MQIINKNKLLIICALLFILIPIIFELSKMKKEAKKYTKEVINAVEVYYKMEIINQRKPKMTLDFKKNKKLLKVDNKAKSGKAIIKEKNLEIIDPIIILKNVKFEKSLYICNYKNNKIKCKLGGII